MHPAMQGTNKQDTPHTLTHPKMSGSPTPSTASDWSPRTLHQPGLPQTKKKIQGCRQETREADGGVDADSIAGKEGRGRGGEGDQSPSVPLLPLLTLVWYSTSKLQVSHRHTP